MRRLTFEGDYNARAAYAPDGRHIALVTRVAGRYRIGLLDVQRGNLRLLSNGELDESPGLRQMVAWYCMQVARMGVMCWLLSRWMVIFSSGSA